jgi:hypothetical protein
MTESKSEIGFQQAGLGSILKHNRLVVPPNQREYAWTDRQVKQLLQDFARAINDGDDYFLGTIVTIPRMNGTLEVVDGQQRLATTAILLAAIRDYLSDRHEDFLVEAINNEFLTGIDRGRRERVPKLKLNVDDNELFSHIVTSHPLPNPSKDSHERLLVAAEEARKHVRSIVASYDAKDHGDLLDRWVSFIEQKALAVLLRVPDDADAYKMFETLNDRGLRTSQADLIKNYLFGRSGGRIDEAQNRWSYMRGALESLEDGDVTTVTFLRHALITLRGFLREAEVYDVVQSMVKSEQAAVSFATSLENLANAYVASFNPEHVRWNDYPDHAHRAVKVFNLLNIKPMRPLLLAVTIKMNQKEAASSFQFLLSLGVRLLIASSTRSGSVELPLAEAANLVYGEEIDSVAKLRTKLAAIIPTDRDFREACENARVSNSQLARYYLRSLEMAAKGEKEPWFMPTDDRSIINLEHVLPKKPEGNWPSFDEESVKSYANRLGNLALLRASNNSELESDAFSDKRVVYAASPYLLTNQIGELAEWTPEAITNRQRQLAQLAVKTWPIRGHSN